MIGRRIAVIGGDDRTRTQVRWPTGDIEVTVYKSDTKDAQRLVERARNGHVDHIVAIAKWCPPSVMSVLKSQTRVPVHAWLHAGARLSVELYGFLGLRQEAPIAQAFNGPRLVVSNPEPPPKPEVEKPKPQAIWTAEETKDLDDGVMTCDGDAHLFADLWRTNPKNTRSLAAAFIRLKRIAEHGGSAAVDDDFLADLELIVEEEAERREAPPLPPAPPPPVSPTPPPVVVTPAVPVQPTPAPVLPVIEIRRVDPPGWACQSEAASSSGLSVSTIHRCGATGEIRRMKSVSGIWIYSQEDALRLAQARALKAKPKETATPRERRPPVEVKAPDTKRCPFCAEEILSAAIKCKHCGTMLGEAPQKDPIQEALSLIQTALKK